MFGKFGEKVGVAVISAIILGALALVWNFASSGGLVKALGGVPKAELEAMIGHPHPAAPALAPVAAMPKDAVVAFDMPGACPEGWSTFAEAQSRAIVGAFFGSGFVAGLGADERREQLTEYKYRQHGGEEMVALTVEQFPSHLHALQLHYAYNFAQGNAFILTGQDGPVEDGDSSKFTFSSDFKLPREDQRSATETVGSGQPHNNMPPYVALYFCKKD